MKFIRLHMENYTTVRFPYVRQFFCHRISCVTMSISEREMKLIIPIFFCFTCPYIYWQLQYLCILVCMCDIWPLVWYDNVLCCFLLCCQFDFGWSSSPIVSFSVDIDVQSYAPFLGVCGSAFGICDGNFPHWCWKTWRYEFQNYCFNLSFIQDCILAVLCPISL